MQVMLLLAIASGGWIAARPKPSNGDLRLWTFADSHARSYRQMAPAFREQSGRTLGLS